MMISYLFMAILAGNLYNQVNSAGLPKPTPLTRILNEGRLENQGTLEHKIEFMLESITRMESSIQNLQEKSHTWSIFQHHIESWNDGLRVLENKIDFLKRSHEDQQLALNKMDITLHENTDINEIKDALKKEQTLQKESATKVNAILRHLQTMHKEKNGNINASHGKKKSNLIAGDAAMADTQSSTGHCNGSHKLEQRLNSIQHQMALQRDLKQLHSMDKRMSKSIEHLSQSMTHALDKQDELSSRLQRSNECCYALSSELTTFTESSDILLKRIERLIKNVNDKLNRIQENNAEEHHHHQQEEDGEEDREEEEDNNINEGDEFENTTNHIHLEVFHEEVGVKEEETEHHRSHEEGEEEDEVEEEPVVGNVNHERSEHEDSQTELYGRDIEFLRPDLNGCHELTNENGVDESLRIDGIYKFASPDINEIERDFNERLCVFVNSSSPTDVAWTVIQRRLPLEHPENFNRSWSEYRNGFGSLQHDFWFGNEFIHRLVYNEDYELRIELEDFNSTRVWAEYGIFRLDSEEFNYNLLIGEYKSESTVADAMQYHNDNDFSTYDRRNDKTVDACCSCAMGYGSGWWFDNCSEANLNGIYRFTPWGNNYNGIMWELWHGDYSLKSTRMMIRPKQQHSEDRDVLYSSSSYYDIQEHHNEDP